MNTEIQVFKDNLEEICLELHYSYQEEPLQDLKSFAESYGLTLTETRAMLGIAKKAIGKMDMHVGCPDWPMCDEFSMGCVVLQGLNNVEWYGHRD
jgi:hypothetical protein